MDRGAPQCALTKIDVSLRKLLTCSTGIAGLERWVLLCATQPTRITGGRAVGWVKRSGTQQNLGKC